jgi:hypothetical protein
MAWRRHREILISTQVDRAFRDWLEKGRKLCGNQPVS